MPTRNLNPDSANNNKRAVVVSDDPRVIHLEGRVERVEGDVRDIKAGVQKLLDRPQSPGFSQVITTLVSTLAFCAFIFAFAEWRLGQAVAPVSAEIVTMKTQAGWASDSVHATNIKAAVMEERMRWVHELAKGKTAP